MVELSLVGLCRMFGPVRAVDDLSLTVRDGEFLTLLGPSGCGKTTVLNIVAGLDPPTRGAVRLNDRVVTDAAAGVFVAPERRDIGMVFQSYALWPHMTVADNLALPLKLRGVPKAERRARIADALSLVELQGVADRYPFQLSGGQQQRVALARALVYQPGLLLLDEPLSNLDAKLRDRARLWLRALQRRLGITTVYVTHDQAEALAISDRIAVMADGRLLQVGAPAEIYERPVDARVADFVGSANLLSGRVTAAEGGRFTVRVAGARDLHLVGNSVAVGDAVTVAVRPERIRLATTTGDNRFEVAIVGSAYQGASHLVDLDLSGACLRAQFDRMPGEARPLIHIPAEACRLLPRGDGAIGDGTG